MFFFKLLKPTCKKLSLVLDGDVGAEMVLDPVAPKLKLKPPESGAAELGGSKGGAPESAHEAPPSSEVLLLELTCNEHKISLECLSQMCRTSISDNKFVH